MMRALALIPFMLLVLSCAAQPLQPRQAHPQTPTLKVMTFNVNYGVAGDESTLLAMSQEGADVILLQETTPEWERAIRERLSAAYPHMVFRHCCGAGGLAVLSRFELEDKDYIQAPAPGWFPAWLLTTTTPLGEVQLLNVHLRPPVSDSGSFVSGYFSTPKVREAEITAYRGRLDPKLPTIIAGDFNENAHGDAVEHLEEQGLRSVLPEYSPDRDTWRWPTSFGTMKAQLDHIIYDPKHYAPLTAYVVEAGRSDHLPVVAVFERQAR